MAALQRWGCSAARSDSWPTGLGVAGSVIRGLCRSAIEGAVRQLVITAAVGRTENITRALKVLGKKGGSSARVEHAISVAARALPATQHCMTAHLRLWSSGAHGTDVPGGDLATEIPDAELACDELVGWRPRARHRCSRESFSAASAYSVSGNASSPRRPDFSADWRAVSRVPDGTARSGLLLLLVDLPEERWPETYRIADRARAVHRETSDVLHSRRAFADVPETLVAEWESVTAEVERIAGRR